mmetsp:Transcript_23647/g.51878  ORF Transcript_23647/g.51878 Transcript_23647/m.51878 type:complete len:216 (+) Transcript_23647:1011-1658(+)
MHWAVGQHWQMPGAWTPPAPWQVGVAGAEPAAAAAAAAAEPAPGQAAGHYGSDPGDGGVGDGGDGGGGATPAAGAVVVGVLASEVMLGAAVHSMLVPASALGPYEQGGVAERSAAWAMLLIQEPRLPAQEQAQIAVQAPSAEGEVAPAAVPPLAVVPEQQGLWQLLQLLLLPWRLSAELQPGLLAAVVAAVAAIFALAVPAQSAATPAVQLAGAL